NLPDTRHRIKDALRPVFPKDTGEDRQEHVSVLGRMSGHGIDRHHRHLTYKIPPRMGTLMMQTLRAVRRMNDTSDTPQCTQPRCATPRCVASNYRPRPPDKSHLDRQRAVQGQAL